MYTGRGKAVYEGRYNVYRKVKLSMKEGIMYRR